MTQKRCVLYIEDDATSRILVSRVLGLSFEVISASNGIEGLDALQQRLPDIVLTDLNLPDLNGEIIAARIRATAGRDIPIVALTAQTDRHFKRRALAAGCVGYITKPIEASTLAATINEYIDGRTEQLSEPDQRRGTQEIQAELTERLEKTVRQLQEDNAELRQLERSKTAFLTQASHELRTPLTVLSGYVQMLTQQLERDEVIDAMHRDLAHMASDAVKRMQMVMNEVVVMTRLAANELEILRASTRIGTVAQEAIDAYREALQQRRIQLESGGDAWNHVLMADSALLRLAISNLVSNAIKFTPDGGKVVVRIERDPGREAGAPDMLHMTVCDNGVGIMPDNLRLLFKPFFSGIDVSRGRTSKTSFMGMGMGIGLSIVSHVAQAHRGRVWAESKGYSETEFPGSTFHFVLPLDMP